MHVGCTVQRYAVADQRFHVRPRVTEKRKVGGSTPPLPTRFPARACQLAAASRTPPSIAPR